jgi:hypothetical protein
MQYLENAYLEKRNQCGIVEDVSLRGGGEEFLNKKSSRVCLFERGRAQGQEMSQSSILERVAASRCPGAQE